MPNWENWQQEGLSRNAGAFGLLDDRISTIEDDLSVPTDTVPPSTSPAAEVIGGFGFLAVDWELISNNDPVLYEVHLSTTSGFTPSSSTKLGEALSGPAIITNIDGAPLTHDITYYVKIVAKDPDGSAAPGAQGSDQLRRVGPGDVSGDGSPPALSPAADILAGPKFLAVRWTPITNADPVLYEVHLSTTSGFTPSVSTKVGEINGTTMFVYNQADGTALQFDTTYYVRIVARDVDGTAPPGTQDSDQIIRLPGDWITDGQPPSSSPGATVISGVGFFAVRWEEVINPDPVRYEVHISTTSGFTPGSSTLYGITPANSILINRTAGGAALAYDTTYYVRLIASDDDGSALPGTQDSGQLIKLPSSEQTGDGAAPASSPTPTLTPGPKFIAARWTPVTNNDPVAYEVHVSTTTGFTPNSGTLLGELSGTSLVINRTAGGSELAYSTTYYVKIVAKDVDGAAAAGAQASAQVVKLPTADVTTDGLAPTSSPAATVEGGPTFLFALWTPITNADPVTYDVHVSTTSGFTPSGSTKFGETAAGSIIINNTAGGSALATGTTYYVRIVARDADGSAAPGTQASAQLVALPTSNVTSDGFAPASSPTPTLEPGVGIIAAKWTPITNNDPVVYEVHVSTTNNFTPAAGTLVGQTAAGSFVIRNTAGGPTLIAATTYYVKIVARDADGAAAASTQASAQLVSLPAADISGQLVASQLAISIGGGNAISNSSLENGTTNFNVNGTANSHVVEQSADRARFGTKSGKVTFTDTGSGGFIAIDYLTVSPDDPVAASTYVWPVEAGNFHMWVQWMTDAGAHISYTPSGDKPLTAGSWQRFVLTATAPATAGRARILFRRQNAVAGESFYFDGVQLEAADVVTAYAPRPGEILPGTITATEIADDAVTTPKLITNAVVAAKIAAGAIETDKLAANAVTAAKILANTITAVQIAANTITAAQIAANTITANQIAANAITAAEIAAQTITAAEIATNTITAVQIATNTITAVQIAANTITAAQIAANTITAAQIAANTITANQIAANTITAAQIATNTITAVQIAANTITAAQIATNTITANQIAANTITGNKISANTITGALIAGNTITGNNIAANTITVNELATNSVSAAQIQSGSISVDKLVVGGIAGNNLLKDSSFEEGLGNTGIIGTGTTRESSTERARTGTKSIKVVTPGTVANEGAWVHTDNPEYSPKLEPGKTYVFSAYARGSGTVRIWVNWRSATNATLGTSVLGDSVVLNDTTWTRVFLVATVPDIDPASGGPVDHSIFGVRTVTPAQAVTFWMDDAQTEEGGIPTAWTPFNSRTGITATEIAANTITANEIAGGTISGDLLNATVMMTGKKIVAGNPTSNRVELGENGIRAYSVGGSEADKTVDIPSDGLSPPFFKGVFEGEPIKDADFAQPTVVQSATIKGTYPGMTFTFPTAHTAGNALIVAIYVFNGGTSIPSGWRVIHEQPDGNAGTLYILERWQLTSQGTTIPIGLIIQGTYAHGIAVEIAGVDIPSSDSLSKNLVTNFWNDTITTMSVGPSPKPIRNKGIGIAFFEGIRAGTGDPVHSSPSTGYSLVNTQAWAGSEARLRMSSYSRDITDGARQTVTAATTASAGVISAFLILPGKPLVPPVRPRILTSSSPDAVLATNGNDVSSVPIPRPTVRVYRTTTRWTVHAENTVIPMSATRWDRTRMYDNDTPSRITFVLPGVYLISANVVFDTATGGVREAWITVNGSTQISRTKIPAAAGNDRLNLATAWRFEEGDYIELYARQTSGGGLAVLSTDTSPEVDATWIAD